MLWSPEKKLMGHVIRVIFLPFGLVCLDESVSCTYLIDDVAQAMKLLGEKANSLSFYHLKFSCSPGVTIGTSG